MSAPSSTAKRSLGSAFRRAKAIMQSPNGDPIAALRELEGKRRQIEAHFQGLLKRAADYGREATEARKEFFSQYTVETLEKFVQTSVFAEPAHEVEAFLGRQISTGLCGEKFRAENPKFREALVTAAEFRLSNAQQGFDAAFAKERKRLSGKGFDREQIEDSPEVKRARSAVERCTLLLQRAKTAPVEVVWQNCGQLLDDD